MPKKKSFLGTFEDVRDWCIEHWFAGFVAVVVTVAMTIVGWNVYNNHQKEVRDKANQAAEVSRIQEVAAEAARLELLKTWALLPEPPLPVIGTPPPTPTLDPLGFEVSGDGSDLIRDTQKVDALELRLKRLVETHPRYEISTVFNSRVLSGELQLNFQPEKGEIAAFGVLPRSMISAMQKPDNRPLLPVFVISLAALADIDTPEEIREAWLVLFHENHHYEQYLAAPDAEKTLFVSRVVKAGEPMTPRECDHMWAAERDAYQSECHLALDWGMPDVWGGLCRKVDDEAAFSQALFLWMQSGSPVKGCSQLWATSAGHPHPEAYAIPR